MVSHNHHSVPECIFIHASLERFNCSGNLQQLISSICCVAAKTIGPAGPLYSIEAVGIHSDITR